MDNWTDRKQVIVARGMDWDEWVSVFLVRDTETPEQTLNRAAEALAKENDLPGYDIEMIEGNILRPLDRTPVAILAVNGSEQYKLSLQTADMIYA